MTAEISNRLRRVERGGPGSGHFGHKGRPGKVGGSLPSDSGSKAAPAEESGSPTNVEVKNRSARRRIDTVLRLFRRKLGDAMPDNITVTDDSSEVEQYIKDGWNLDPNDPIDQGVLQDIRSKMQRAIASYVNTSTAAKRLRNRMVYVDPKNYIEAIGENPDWAEYVVAHEVGHLIDQSLLTPARMGMMPPKPPDPYTFQMRMNGYSGAKQIESEYVADLIATSLLRGQDFKWFGTGSRIMQATDQIRKDASQQWEYLGTHLKMRSKPQSRRRRRPTITVGQFWPGATEVIIGGPEPEPAITKTMRRVVERGGPGSGHFGHKGRPGEVGGSQPSTGSGGPTLSDAPINGLELLENPPPAPGLIEDDPLLKSNRFHRVTDWEARHRNPKSESSYIVDLDGPMELETEGSETSVEYAPEMVDEIAAVPGRKILTHTHPADMPFSFNDLYGAHRMDVLEIRAVTDRNIYRLVLQPDRSEDRVSRLLHKMKIGWIDVSDEAYDAVMQSIDSGSPVLQANSENMAEPMHELWTDLWNDYPDVIRWYDREPRQ